MDNVTARKMFLKVKAHSRIIFPILEVYVNILESDSCCQIKPTFYIL